jgi:hypothetical protein
MVTSYCKTLKIINNLAEKPDLTLETCVNLANSFLAKFSKKFKRIFSLKKHWVQFCTSLPRKKKAGSKPHPQT